MRTRLKLFVENDEQQQGQSTQANASMPLGDFARIIADAVTWDRTWVQDFADEPVILSQDLHEIIKIYDEVRQARA